MSRSQKLLMLVGVVNLDVKSDTAYKIYTKGVRMRYDPI